MRVSPKKLRKIRRVKRQGMVMSVNLVSMIDIFVILIIYLLVNAVAVQVIGAEQVKLPESIAQDPPRETTVVIISEVDILIDGDPVMKVADAMSVEGDELVVLRDRLLAELPPPPPAGTPADKILPPEVNILADKTIEYSLLKKVMTTCGKAKYGRISLGVIPKAAAGD